HRYCELSEGHCDGLTDITDLLAGGYYPLPLESLHAFPGPDLLRPVPVALAAAAPLGLRHGLRRPGPAAVRRRHYRGLGGYGVVVQPLHRAPAAPDWSPAPRARAVDPELLVGVHPCVAEDGLCPGDHPDRRWRGRGGPGGGEEPGRGGRGALAPGVECGELPGTAGLQQRRLRPSPSAPGPTVRGDGSAAAADAAGWLPDRLRGRSPDPHAEFQPLRGGVRLR